MSTTSERKTRYNTARIAEMVEWHATPNDPLAVDPQAAIVDVVADLRHLAASLAVDFGAALRLSEIHYRNEREALKRVGGQ